MTILKFIGITKFKDNRYGENKVIYNFIGTAGTYKKVFADSVDARAGQVKFVSKIISRDLNEQEKYIKKVFYSLVESLKGKTFKISEQKAVIKQKPNIKDKKENLYTERLTLPISPAHRDFLDSFINSLKRQKKISTKEINRNSVIRALITLLEKNKIETRKAPKIITEDDLVLWIYINLIGENKND